MNDPFQVRVAVRGYELDTQGHLNQAVYLQYFEHARWECLRAAGIAQQALLNSGVGPAALENTMRFHRELSAGDEVDISCEWIWGERKTFRVEQRIVRADGVLSAELTGRAGLLDLTARRLIADPLQHLTSLASQPELLVR